MSSIAQYGDASRRAKICLGFFAAITALASIVASEVTSADVAGCEYKAIDVGRYGQKLFRNPPEILAKDETLSTQLRVAYTDRSKTVLGECPLKLRTYRAWASRPNTPACDT